MQEDGQILADLLADKDGVFYLCGPTWYVALQCKTSFLLTHSH